MEETRNDVRRNFDKEYMTEWRRETGYLRDRGIMYSYSRKTKDGVVQYKYTKTAKLFKTLFEFYSMVERERGDMDGEIANILKQAGFSMRRGKDGEVRFSKMRESFEGTPILREEESAEPAAVEAAEPAEPDQTTAESQQTTAAETEPHQSEADGAAVPHQITMDEILKDDTV